MAGAATVTTSLSVTGLGDTTSIAVTETATVPVEKWGGYFVLLTAQTTAYPLATLTTGSDLTKMYLLVIEAVVGDIYLQFDTAGDTTFAAAAADIVIPTGGCGVFHLSPTNNAGVCIDGSAITAAMNWCLLESA